MSRAGGGGRWGGAVCGRARFGEGITTMCSTERQGVRRTGFSLLELIVAIAAVAVISVGLAALFSSVGRTVSGGRRVSVLNTYAALVENRMRRDFLAMSREGPLVIRQQWVQREPAPTVSPNPTTANDLIPLTPDDLRPRRRRADEIVFFARGEFISSRPPVHPDVNARSDTARVYYGHGQARNEVLTPGSLYLRPQVNDFNSDVQAVLGTVSGFGGPNVNRFASDWTLLRLQTLLVEPETTRRTDYPGVPGRTFAQTADGDRQIGMQPAMGSLFRWLANRPLPGPPAPPAAAQLVRQEAGAQFPVVASGLVDVATTDLDEIRATVLGALVLPSAVAPGDAFPSPSTVDTEFMWTDATGTTGATRPATPLSLDRQHAWMEQLMPAPSAASNPGGAVYPLAGEVPGTRTRFEPQPPDYFESIDGATAANTDLAIRRADQIMIGANNFLPRCSEFIVEWSYGLTDANGQLVWYGPRRTLDLDNDRLPDPGEPAITLPYPFTPTGVSLPLEYRYERVGVTTLGTHTVTDRLIYGYAPLPETSVLTSYFGYIDPTFRPPQDTDGDGRVDTGQPAIAAVAWAWPRMIRVTIVLSDAQDASIESSFQFIFTTPEAGES
ncbi:MAG: prepilin-type N-terminal cleavage/methylation domain-containing protein [Planctomycetota bacterium]|nr:prepilin-type N-terminal cleavage/methylation domain-containing protein [Planctomycetota bacterium]